MTIEDIRSALAGSSARNTFSIVPTVFVNRQGAWAKAQSHGADWAISWYTQQGLIADRTRQNLYGYPGLLRDFYYERYGADDYDSPSALPAEFRNLAADFEKERLALRSAIGEPALEAVWDAVFGEDGDEMDIAPGVPDLLVWSPDASLWFFSEVKLGADSLRQSQKEWLWRNREIVSGHYLLTILM